MDEGVLLIDRNLVNEKFRYKTNDFNFRLGFLEETTVTRQVLYSRINHWKNVFIRHCVLQPSQNIIINLNQNSLDTFALYFAAFECDLNITDSNPNFTINLFNYFDLSALRFDGDVDYKQKGISKIYGIDSEIVYKHVKKTSKKLDIFGNVLHTKFNNKNFLNYFLPSLAKKIECHYALGYNTEIGLDKIAHIIQKCAIDCVILPDVEAVELLKYYCKQRNVNIDNLKIFT